MNKVKNYGLIAPEKIETREEGAEHILGVGDPIINPSGIWEWFRGETQRLGIVETFACTVFNTIRAIETLIKFHTGVEVNYLKRYLANVAKFKGVLDPKSGADPHKIAELIRTVAGLLKEGKLVEWDESIKSNEDYYNLKDIELLIKDGQEWWNEWGLRHKWVWSGNPSPEEKQRLLKEALKTGTVCVSVVAWKERNGFYYKERKEKDTHWTGLERYDGGMPIVEDSYPESEGDFEKVLEPNYDFGIAKVYFLTKTETLKKQVSILTQIVEAFKKLVELFKQKKQMEIKTLDEIPVPEIIKKVSKLNNWAKAIETFESAPKSWNNPGAIKNRQGQFLTFKSYDEGFNYLKDYLTRAATGKHLAYPKGGESTLLEFQNIYSPSYDRNDPHKYASFVAARLDATIETKIKEFI